MNLDKSLSDLKGASAAVSPGIGYPEPGQASIQLLFSDGTRLEAEYWRLAIEGKVGVSSFDHRQKYGLPAPIDAIDTVHETLREKPVTNAFLDHKTGDLLLEFAGNITVQVLNLTSYEDWHIAFSDGTGKYSNHVRFTA